MGSNGVDISVLVVDDDADLRSALTEYISKMGVRVRTAGNLAEAQKLLQTEAVPFDLVLCDLKIPGGSGMDVLRAAHTRSPESLVTIITGYASIETAIEAIRLGAYNYITKPFSLSEIGVQPDFRYWRGIQPLSCLFSTKAYKRSPLQTLYRAAQETVPSCVTLGFG